MTRVLIADDHAIVRRGVREILTDLPADFQIEEAGSAREAVKRNIEHSYEIVLLDISFPDGNGLDVMSQILAINPNTKILFLSVYPEEQYARRALKAGAYGYLTKDSAPTELESAINRILGGGKYITRSLAARLAEDIGGPVPQAPHERLSDREFQIMMEIASGKSNAQIATHLSLSPKTVSTYRSRLLEKLNLSTNAEIIRYALDNNLG